MHPEVILQILNFDLFLGSLVKLLVSHVDMRVNNWYICNHPTTIWPFWFLLPVQNLRSCMRQSSLCYKIGFVLNDLARLQADGGVRAHLREGGLSDDAQEAWCIQYININLWYLDFTMGLLEHNPITSWRSVFLKDKYLGLEKLRHSEEREHHTQGKSPMVAWEMEDECKREWTRGRKGRGKLRRTEKHRAGGRWRRRECEQVFSSTN